MSKIATDFSLLCLIDPVLIERPRFARLGLVQVRYPKNCLLILQLFTDCTDFQHKYSSLAGGCNHVANRIKVLNFILQLAFKVSSCNSYIFLEILEFYQFTGKTFRSLEQITNTLIMSQYLNLFFIEYFDIAGIKIWLPIMLKMHVYYINSLFEWSMLYSFRNKNIIRELYSQLSALRSYNVIAL